MRTLSSLPFSSFGALLLSVVFALSPTPVVSEELEFKTKPNRCVALRQGQVCYQKIKFQWKNIQPGNYCLHKKDEPSPLICWQDASIDEYVYAFSATESQEFELKKDANVVAAAKITVSWVYKTSKRVSTGWRLF